MKLSFVMTTALLAAVSSFASVKDFYFHKEGDRFCVSASGSGGISVDAKGNVCEGSTSNDVRIRVINAQENPGQAFGFDIERPFLILDGIYLSPDGRRTLSELHFETNKFGMPNLLSELGYTPILVQFAETVERSLTENAQYFTELLKFINNNRLFGFANKNEDGFIVMGISQGGILGRYGSYKYDMARKSTDAPIRMYASMDSPHQGAVMPKGLLYTINFWAKQGGSAAAEAFNDMVEGPGASQLLINQSETDTIIPYIWYNTDYAEDFSDNRFLFGEYRKAAEYKGFPAVLIAQGQLKGKTPAHQEKFFGLNRKAEYAGMLMGRAVSEMYAPGEKTQLIAYNRKYQKPDGSIYKEPQKPAKYDFVQGSTYPFARTMYESLREGILDAIPDKMKYSVANIFGMKVNIDLSTSWDEDSLYQANSTFIPTVSAMDLKCDGELSITKPCAFSQSYSGIDFEKPGSRSSAVAAYAVDPTHPRFAEAISGRHIELPDGFSRQDSAIIRGMQTDVWRVLCEVAKLDYDANQKRYRNPNLTEYIQPDASCMDASRIPDIVKNAGFLQTKSFAYARYDYNKTATEKNESVGFDLAAGWHKVAMFDNGEDLPEGSAFEVDIQVDHPKGNWMKAELLLHRSKSGYNQLQLTEVPVPLDGKRHTIRWQVPFAGGAASGYRWLRLVLNSDGGHVTLSNLRLVHSGIEMLEPEAIKSNVIYPNVDYSISPWSSSTSAVYSSGTNGNLLNVTFQNHGSGLFFQLGDMRSLMQYSKLKVVYAAGTCQSTGVYFDSYKSGIHRLNDGVLQNGMLVSQIPLDEIINTQVTPNFSRSASRLSLSSMKASETCAISKITLE